MGIQGQNKAKPTKTVVALEEALGTSAAESTSSITLYTSEGRGLIQILLYFKPY